MHVVVRRLTLPLLAFAIVAACSSLEGPKQVEIPEGAFIYKFAPGLLTYEGVDSTLGGHFEFTWLSGEAFFGANCLAFLPTTPTDSTGSFVFAWSGQNIGRVERRSNGVPLDTVTGYFMATDPPGTHGSYAVSSTGALTLNWADGARNRYFAPTASLRLVTDTVEAFADIKARGDSIRDQWHVYWVASTSCFSG